MATQQLTPPPASVPASVLSEQASYYLAAELAAQLYTVPDILKRFELTKSQLKKITKDPHFRELFAEAKALWNGSGNVKERIRKKAALLLEDSIMPIYSIIHDVNVTPPARIEAFAKLVAIADMQPTKQDGSGNTSDKFVLNITFGNEKKTVVIDSTTVPEPEALL